jgi:two-component system sensor histidine kinase and response regulator WspE
MSKDAGKSIADLSMLELFQVEVETQTAALTQGLLELERDPADARTLERLMRGSHSLKGAARLVGMSAIERVTHAMEDVFVGAQQGAVTVDANAVDINLKSIDLIKRLTSLGAVEPDGELAGECDRLIATLEELRAGRAVQLPAAGAAENVAPARVNGGEPAAEAVAERVVRVNAERLTRILGLASELVVDGHRAHQQTMYVLHLKQRHVELTRLIDALRDAVGENASEVVRSYIAQLRRRSEGFDKMLTGHYGEVDSFDRRLESTAARIHREVVLTRMRPFADGVAGFQRMVRDIARSLDKKVELVITGLNTEVDRDILDQLEGSLTHLIRNAIDHGIESPAQRRKRGKPEHGTIELSAAYSAGSLRIEMRDDGAGVDFARLRKKIVERGLASKSLAGNLSEDELLEFLFLPKFSTRDEVTELSGRGVGLDVVHNVIQQLGGTIRTRSSAGQGTRFRLQLPITLSLLPSLLVEIAQESYAFPLSRIDRLLKLSRDDVLHIENRQYAVVDDENVGLVSAATLFGKPPHHDAVGAISVVIVSDRLSRYGVVVDRIVGERVLAVQGLDWRLGKIRDIAAAALLEDGSPTLIIDVDDLVRSIDNATRAGALQQLGRPADTDIQRVAKHVLVVDDSITVRGVEAKLLEARGYRVTTAVDGMDGWNRVRAEPFDLVITDVDMPRMDGLELVHMIKNDPHTRHLPVMIVSYKDRPEDRRRGLDAGADYYLTKSSFHDETLIEAVEDLVGK